MKTLNMFVAALLLSAGVVNAAGADKAAIPDVPSGHAQIVFMRHSTVNMLANMSIFDVTSGQPRFVNKNPNGRKVVVDLAPGDYVFMVGNAPIVDFMKATVSADKRYFVIISPGWPAHFSPRPVKHQNNDFLYSSKEFAELLKKTKLAEQAEPMDADDLKKFADAYGPQWEKWQAKTPEQQAILTMRPEDSYK